MSYGRMNSEQRDVVLHIVEGREVIDLGCGDLGWANMLAEHSKVVKVVAIDSKKPHGSPLLIDSKVEFVQTYFEHYTGPVPEVAFLSWPVNHVMPALLRILEQVKTIVYLGKNTDGTSCGWPGLFCYLSKRRIIVHRPTRANVLTVYGERGIRARTGEEVAAIEFCDHSFLSYERSRMLAQERAVDPVARLGELAE